MSYDVSVYFEGLSSDDLNYTYNLSEMFYWAMDGDGIPSLDGKLCSEAAPVLAQALAKLDSTPYADLAKFEPSNGYGSVEGGIEFLRKIHRLCIENPSARVSVS